MGMDVCDVEKENKSPISIPKIKFEKNMNLQLMVEDLINEQNIKREIIQDEDSNLMLAQDTKTIIHISPMKLPKNDNANIIHSPICKEYNQKLQKLQARIKSFSPECKIKRHSVSTTGRSSACTSMVSSVGTSMVSSLESSEVRRLFGSNLHMKVTDSMLSGISISETDTLCGGDDSSDSSSDQEYDDLRESLNRQWTDIQD